MSASAPSPIWQLTLSRLREFYREPAAVFWVYGFPLVLALALGTAFRERPVERIKVDLFETEETRVAVEELETKLKNDPRIETTRVQDAKVWKERLRGGKTDLVVTFSPSSEGKPKYDLWQEQNRPESVLALSAVQNALLKQTVSTGPTMVDHKLEETGARYIDFLIPGLIGMNLMGGGLWGVGFVIVDMRVRKLLKRFLATPMVRSHFLISIMFSRIFFTIPEVILLLGFGYLMFGVTVTGSLLVLLAVFFLGAVAFSGIGLLVASRAKTTETVSGLMNLVMMPMFVLSGVFFEADRFPEQAQIFIQALPLTALNNAIRAVMLNGKGLFEIWQPLAILGVWAVVSFTIALRIFRWR